MVAIKLQRVLAHMPGQYVQPTSLLYDRLELIMFTNTR